MFGRVSRRLLSAGSRKTPRLGQDAVVPDQPTASVLPIDMSSVPPFSHAMIARLESMSLVRFSDEQAVANLRTAVAKANVLKEVNTEGVESMYYVWEEMECHLDEDVAEEPLGVDKLLANVSVHRDGYLVAPQGNVPLEEEADRLDLETIHQFEKKGKHRNPEVKKNKKKQL